MHLQGNVRSYFTQRLPHTVPSNAAANRKYLRGERKDFLAYAFCQKSLAEICAANVACTYARVPLQHLP
jgi:hypothetical protein